MSGWLVRAAATAESAKQDAVNEFGKHVLKNVLGILSTRHAAANKFRSRALSRSTISTMRRLESGASALSHQMETDERRKYCVGADYPARETMN